MNPGHDGGGVRGAGDERGDDLRDDQDWFEAIAGRPRPGADPRTLLEAAWLRAATRQWAPRARVEPREVAPRPDETEALLARARAEGLLLPRRAACAGCRERWQRLWRAIAAGGRRGGTAGLVAAALAVALVGGVWRSAHEGAEGDGPPVLRGAPADGLWLLQAADPVARREALAAELSAAGAAVTRYERLGRFGLDAEIGAAPSAALRETLRRHGLQAASDGSLRVEIERTPP